MFVAERFDLRVYLIANPTCLCQPFVMGSAKLRGIIKWPMQPRRDAWKNRAALRFSFAADGDYKLKDLPRLPNVEPRCVWLFEMSIPSS